MVVSQDMPATIWSVEHEGHTVEVVPDGLLESGDRVRLVVDGDEVAEAKAAGRQTLSGAGVEVRIFQPPWGGGLRDAELLADNAVVALAPAPGSRAARREDFARRHPLLYSARHVATGVAQVLIPLLGLAALLSFLPSISLPDVDLPNVDLPSLPLPSIDLPRLPEWVRDVLDKAKFVTPILVGIALAVREQRRRARRSEGEKSAEHVT